MGRTDSIQQTKHNPDSLTFTTKGLTKVYGEGEAAVHALRGVDLEIPSGEMVVLLGPSGSGKSTLLNILGGLDRGTDGTVHFQDQELSAMSDAQLTRYRREHVGFVFQFYNLMPSLTAHENVELVTEIAADPMTPEAALGLVGLGNAPTISPANSLAASNSVLPSPAPLPSNLRCCSATSPPAHSIAQPDG